MTLLLLNQMKNAVPASKCQHWLRTGRDGQILGCHAWYIGIQEPDGDAPAVVPYGTDQVVEGGARVWSARPLDVMWRGRLVWAGECHALNRCPSSCALASPLAPAQSGGFKDFLNIISLSLSLSLMPEAGGGPEVVDTQSVLKSMTRADIKSVRWWRSVSKAQTRYLQGCPPRFACRRSLDKTCRHQYFCLNTFATLQQCSAVK